MQVLGEMMAIDIPVVGLKESIHNLEILYRGTTGETCPRCGSTDLNKGGHYTYKEKKHPRKICRDCGYAFSIVDFENEGSTRPRAARIFNLDDKKVGKLLDDTIQFGLIKDNRDGTYSCIPSNNKSKTELYHNVPLYHHLLETVGYDLKRSLFEGALKSKPEYAAMSQLKRDTLWRRYKEIAIEVFVCEKKCTFCRTCKKDHHARAVCDVVKKANIENRWKVDIVI